MRTLNRVMFIGHLAADVELRQSKKGTTVANFPLATNRFTKSGSEQRSIADFHRIVAFGKLAEICDQYLCKGTAVYLSGRLVHNKYENKNGEMKYRTEVILDELNILNWKKNPKGENEIKIEPLVADSESEKDLSVV